ncbi:DNA-binding NarL/FixJ family response regulator [Sinorhizobium fredii]|uniref:Two component transcriptional regulator, LuxR family n=1 Tax=Sinorhizobium fredii (strain USDA 257) TaxID=1185652 RepID=I3X1E2_SINF2|nr:response regulator transcription factor [Sinorhizobium fredii]AFL49698.1 Two component transcriptional regulator, LuxR family [Sinorhizobium fredii USDA 257]
MHSVARTYEHSALEFHTQDRLLTGEATKETSERAAPDSALLLLDRRTLDRQCLAQCLVTHGVDIEVLAFGSIDEWRRDRDPHPPLSAILLSLGARKATDPSIASEIADSVKEFRPIPVVVLSDADELAQILMALDCGARGYIPSSVGVDVCVAAVDLARAGGIFVPADSVLGYAATSAGEESARPGAAMFTRRQEDVIRALRRGKANKIIAHELNLHESTVKVHVRNIMKKLKATNRTEVAYKASQMLPAEAGTLA